MVTFWPLCGRGKVLRAPVPNQALSFGVSGLLYNSDSAYRAKEQVGGVPIDGLARAYPFSALPKTSSEFTDQIGKRTIRLIRSVESQSLRPLDEVGRDIPVMVALLVCLVWLLSADHDLRGETLGPLYAW